MTRAKKTTRAALRWGVILASAWLTACVLIGIVATEAGLHPGRRPLGPGETAVAREIAGGRSAELAEVAIAAADGATLRGWSIRPRAGNGDAVILLHGVGDNRSGMLGDADLLLAHGYAVLLPDARAQGISGGAVPTYGILEAGDVRRWFDWLERFETPRCIYGLGDSMGGGEILESLWEEPGLCAVAAESPFASFREAGYDRLGQQFNAGPWLGRSVLRPALEVGFLYARWRYGIDFEKASPENVVAGSHVPVLLIHGLKDTNLPPRHSEMIRARNPTRIPAIVLWEPAEAGHCGAAGAEPGEYQRRLLDWFASHGPR